MARPRTAARDPLKRLLRAWSAGEDVEPEHRDHLVAVAREATREAAVHGFGTFELMTAGLILRLYARCLGTQDNLTLARCLGETIRGLRALKLIGVAGRLRGGGGHKEMFTHRAPKREHEADAAEAAGGTT
jgi:hypothetical protein